MLVIKILALLLVKALSACAYDRHRGYHRHHHYNLDSSLDDDENADDFDYFKLTLIYPSSVCRADDDSVEREDYCEVPNTATPWTIHGLWPNRDSGTFPQFCGGKERKFNVSKLAPIANELEKDWPNLFPKRSKSSLWKHEWEKHGTCAMEVPAVGSELKYFNKSIALYDQLDIFGALKAHGIVPSTEKLYNGLQISRALQSAYGKNVEFHCLRDAKTKKWLLADVRICLTKEFQVMDCKHSRRRSRPRRRTYPLPTYQPCPGDDILYIRSDDSHAASSITTAHKTIPFLLPLYNLWRHLHSQH